MSVDKISIYNFRNIKNETVFLNKNINLLVGENGSGKTSFIESIYYLAHNKSFKTKYLSDIIGTIDNKISLSTSFCDKKIQITKHKNNTLATINNKKIKNAAELTKILPIQLISPDKGFIVGASPTNKRYYLDLGCFSQQQKRSTKYKKI